MPSRGGSELGDQTLVIVVVGLSHHSSPIEIREQAALNDEAADALVRQLLQEALVAEAFAISTCNRTEIVAAVEPRPLSLRSPQSKPPPAHDPVTAIVEAWSQKAPSVDRHLYRYADRDALRHMFRVASSLDSMVLGEPQILGQFKAAVERARENKAIGAELERATAAAYRAAKRIRTETTLGSGQVSVPSVAVELARQIFGDLTGHSALLVGSGDMGETVARLLCQAGAQLFVTGRNQARVEHLAQELGGQSRSYADLSTTLSEVDVIIGTTSAPTYVIDRATVAKAMRQRRGRSLFFIDLAVPRDIDPSVGELANVFVYNIDDFAEVVRRSLASREQEAERAESIVLEELAGFERRQSAEQVTPTVVALRRRLWKQLESELHKSLKGRLKHLAADDREALEKMLDAALKKVLHSPTARLRELAQNGRRDLLDTTLETLETLFELESLSAYSSEEGNSTRPPRDLDLQSGPKAQTK